MAQLTIEINGRPYVVGCEDGQEARLRQLAAVIDEQVKAVARDVGQLGETRLMLMGALVMADEVAELRGQVQTLSAELAQARAAASRIELKAVSALEMAAQKLESMAGA